MEVINYSTNNNNLLYSWLPHDLNAELVVFFPDAFPGKSPLPTGTVVKTKQKNWRKFAVSDCGCGMLLAKSKIKVSEFDKDHWDSLYKDLKAKKGKLGDLGGGNHFLDALQSYDDDSLYLLIHTGSHEKLKIFEDLIDSPSKFDETFLNLSNWAKDNRAEIALMLEKYFDKLDLILEKNHNSFEPLEDGSVIIRKGTVKLLPGEKTIIPSSMIGDVVLVEADQKIANVLNSMSHGTGRVMSRSKAKDLVQNFDYAYLRKQIYIPEMISDASLETATPFYYRNLDSFLKSIENLVIAVKRFSPFAYLGQI